MKTKIHQQLCKFAGSEHNHFLLNQVPIEINYFYIFLYRPETIHNHIMLRFEDNALERRINGDVPYDMDYLQWKWREMNEDFIT